MTINLNSLIQKELINEYAGSEKKRTIVINGEKYLLKMPDPVREKNRMLSYINNSYSEYVVCIERLVSVRTKSTYMLSSSLHTQNLKRNYLS